MQTPHKIMSLVPPFLTALLLCVACVNSAGPQYPCDPSKKLNTFPFCNTKLSIEKRATDLVRRMNLTEKVQQMVNSAAGIPRLGVPSYQWWSEALHGVSDLGPGTKFAGNVPGATMFPQVIHTAATFNATLWELIGQTVSTEARAMHNEGLAGLTFWSPNVNIFRDPRWGRGQETPGEDPLVVSTYAVRYVRGLQGSAAAEGPLKVAACCKHYTAYDLDSWKDVERFTFNAVVSQQDLADTYDPPFKSCVVEGNVASVMCSYNQVNGVPTCADPALLAGTIRGKWRLNGYIVSDCDSVDVFYRQQKYTETPEDAAAVAINAGLDLNCGRFLAQHTEAAVKLGKVNESRVDKALVNNFKVLMRLGWFDGNPATKHPYGSLSASDVCTPKHRQLALEAAQQGVVLLKNLAALPLSTTDLTTLAVIGPNADVTTTMIGNYAGIACNYTTPLQALSQYAKTTKYAPGCNDVLCADDSLIADAANISKDADATVVIVGGDQSLEAEGLDRETLILPGHQQRLVSAVAEASKNPVILVIMSAGPFDISFAINDSSIAGIFWVGYPGELGGQAIADAVFGTVNPSGRLPVTWYPEEYTEIPMTNMRMRADPAIGYPGRTYRFYTGKTIFRFGYGLSYTSFKYSLLSVSVNAQCVSMDGNRCTGVQIDGSECRQLRVEVVVKVSNVGERDGDDVLLLFVSPPWDEGAPIKELVGFARIHVPSRASRSVALEIDICRILMNAHENSIKTGSFLFHVGDLQFPFEVASYN